MIINRQNKEDKIHLSEAKRVDELCVALSVLKLIEQNNNNV